MIIDGDSSDGTVDIIKEYAKKDKRIRVVSEPDQGIYNAMNKGVKLAQGNYINFMNAGDCFHDHNVISKITDIIRKTQPDILCGKAYIYNKNSKVGRLSGRDGLNIRDLLEIIGGKSWVNHQSIFAKTSSLREYYFDESYRIGADWNWFVKNIKDHRNIVFVSTVVCDYVKDGASSEVRNKERITYERKQIAIENNGYIMTGIINVELLFLDILKLSG